MIELKRVDPLEPLGFTVAGYRTADSRYCAYHTDTVIIWSLFCNFWQHWYMLCYLSFIQSVGSISATLSSPVFILPSGEECGLIFQQLVIEPIQSAANYLLATCKGPVVCVSYRVGKTARKLTCLYTSSDAVSMRLLACSLHLMTLPHSHCFTACAWGVPKCEPTCRIPTGYWLLTSHRGNFSQIELKSLM